MFGISLLVTGNTVYVLVYVYGTELRRGIFIVGLLRAHVIGLTYFTCARKTSRARMKYRGAAYMSGCLLKIAGVCFYRLLVVQAKQSVRCVSAFVSRQ